MRALGRSDRALLCAQSATIEGDGGQLAEFWEVGEHEQELPYYRATKYRLSACLRTY